MEFAQFQLQEKMGMLELLLRSLLWFREKIFALKNNRLEKVGILS